MSDLETKEDVETLVLYAVRNDKGEWFRAKGYQGYGKTWVPDLKSARIYAKPGPAKALVTYFVGAYPAMPVPELVELVVTQVRVVDQTARVAKALHRKKLASQAHSAAVAKWEFDQAQQRLVSLREKRK